MRKFFSLLLHTQSKCRFYHAICAVGTRSFVLRIKGSENVKLLMYVHLIPMLWTYWNFSLPFVYLNYMVLTNVTFIFNLNFTYYHTDAKDKEINELFSLRIFLLIMVWYMLFGVLPTIKMCNTSFYSTNFTLGNWI